MTTFKSFELEQIKKLNEFGYETEFYSSTPNDYNTESAYVRIVKDGKTIDVLYHADSMINPIFSDISGHRYSSIQNALNEIISEYQLPSSSIEIEKQRAQKKTLDDTLIVDNKSTTGIALQQKTHFPIFPKLFYKNKKDDYIFQA
ncbi:MAG: hypothetical protein VXZ40_04935 [Nanoarchaeota archaeon]|nr:hypothetical protein [Nanoarchaeota archaeon]